MNAMTMRVVRGADGETRHVPGAFLPPMKAARGKPKRHVPDPIKTNGENAAEQLRLFVERIQRLEEEKRGIADDIKDVYAEAASVGWDAKGIRAIVNLLKLEKHTRDETDAIIDTYREALGLR